MTQSDPNREPENSTVDNWLGQEVERDSKLVDELLEETGGDTAKAEALFEERSAGATPDEGEVRRENGEGFA